MYIIRTHHTESQEESMAHVVATFALYTSKIDPVSH